MDGARCTSAARSVRAGLAASVLLAFAPAGAAEEPTPAQRAYETAVGLLNRGMYELAMPEYERFLATDPEGERAALARYGLAVCHARLDAWAPAAETLAKIEDDADFAFAAEVRLLAAQAALRTGAPAEAAARLDRLLATSTRDELAAQALALLADARAALGEHNAAEMAARRLLSRTPEDALAARAVLVAAGALVGVERDEDAAALLADAPTDVPHDLGDRIALLAAQVAERLGRAEDAARGYAALRDGGWAVRGPALVGAARIAHERGELDAALGHLDALDEDAVPPVVATSAVLLRARVLLDRGDPASARRTLDLVPAGAVGSTADELAYWRARCDLAAGRPAEAARRLAAALAASSESPFRAAMLLDRGVALAQAGELDEASATLALFEREHGGDALLLDALRARAGIEHERAAYGASAAACDRYLAAGGADDSGALRLLAAENALLLGRSDDAIDELRSLLDSGASASVAERTCFRLGTALAERGDLDDAEPLLRSVLRGAATAEAYLPALLTLGEACFAAERYDDAAPLLDTYAALHPEVEHADAALLRLGVCHARRDRAREAVIVLTRLLDDFPESAQRTRARFERGQALLAAGDAAAAERDLRGVLDAADGDGLAAWSLRLLGRIAQDRGDHEAAARLLAEAAERGGADETFGQETSMARGMALLAAGRSQEAIEALADIDAPAARAQRAIALSRAGRTAEALPALDAALALGGVDAAVRAALAYERAACLRTLGRAGEAATALRTLLAGELTGRLRGHALLELATLRMADGAHAEAMPLLDEAAHIDDAPRVQIAYQRGACAFELERYDEAARLLEAFHAAHRDSELAGPALLLAAESLLRLGRHAGAGEAFERLLQAHGDDDALAAPALLRLGEAQAALQRWSASAETFAMHRTRFPDSEAWFQAAFGIAWARENEERYDEAIAGYREIVQRHRGATAARAQFQIGQCRFAQGRLDEALTELLKVDIHHAEPAWSAAALFEAGRCLLARDEPARARAQLMEVVERFGKTPWAELAQRELAAMDAPMTRGDE